MTLETGQMIWDVFLILLEGVVLATILKKWNDYVEAKKERKKKQWLLQNFASMYIQKKPKDLYYFVKLLPAEDLKILLYLLLMELSIVSQTDSSGKRDILTMENAEFLFRLDPKWETQIKLQGKIDVFSFAKPTENLQIYDIFRTFLEQQCRIHQVKL